MSEFEEKLRKIVNEGELWVNEPMSAHTTFRIGGPADFLVTPGTAGQLKEILALCREENQPFFILGNGSNLLVGDRGYSGTMICLSRLSSGVFLRIFPSRSMTVTFTSTSLSSPP